MRIKKHIIKMLAALLMLVSVFTINTNTALAVNMSADEAMNWVRAQNGKALDYDGMYGAQCVDFIYYYYQFLGAPVMGGNAGYYVWNTLPAGWQRIRGGNPQKGDILVWSGDPGHVAIYEDDSHVWHQNWNGAMYVKCLTYAQTLYAGPIACYIRPDWKNEVRWLNPSNLASIDEGYYRLKAAVGDYYLSNASEGYTAGTNLEINEVRKSSSQIFHIVRDGGANGYYNLVHNDTGMLADVDANSTEVFGKIQLWGATGAECQKWGFIGAGDGYYYLITKNSGLCMDVADGRAANGTDVRLFTPNESSAQKWMLEKVTYDCKYSYSGASGGPEDQRFDFNSEVKVSTKIPTRSGYNFAGWYTDYDGKEHTFQPGDKFTPNTDVILKAQWTEMPSLPILVHKHSYTSKVTKPATCAAEGVLTYTCTSDVGTCLNRVYTEPIQKLTTHTYGDWVVDKAATETETGIKSKTCSVCGDKITETIPVIEPENKPEKEPETQPDNKPTDPPVVNPIIDISKFIDVDSNKWYVEYIQYVADNGIMSGYSDGTNRFGVSDSLTRAQFATMIYRMAGEPEIEFKGQFTDVPAGKFYSNAVEWCAANGIITGYKDKVTNQPTGEFGTSAPITRQDIAVILYRYEGDYLKKDVNSQASFDKFIDGSSVSAYASSAMKWCVGRGIISGKNGVELDPKGKATRAEVAAMVTRFSK